MEIVILTAQDLQSFKKEMIEEFAKIIVETPVMSSSRKWLKSKDVLKLLNISSGTLQQMRTNGTIPFSRIGGVIYYDRDMVNEMINTHTTV